MTGSCGVFFAVAEKRVGECAIVCAVFAGRRNCNGECGRCVMAFGRVQCPLAIPGGLNVVAACESDGDSAKEQQGGGSGFHDAVPNFRSGKFLNGSESTACDGKIAMRCRGIGAPKSRFFAHHPQTELRLGPRSLRMTPIANSRSAIMTPQSWEEFQTQQAKR